MHRHRRHMKLVAMFVRVACKCFEHVHKNGSEIGNIFLKYLSRFGEGVSQFF